MNSAERAFLTIVIVLTFSRFFFISCGQGTDSDTQSNKETVQEETRGEGETVGDSDPSKDSTGKKEEKKSRVDLFRAAVKDGNVQKVKDLLDKGVSIDTKFEDDWTALHFAIKNGHLDLAHFLIDEGAQISYPTEDVTSPLWLAANYGRAQVVNTLLKKNVEVSKDSFLIAAYQGYFEVVKELVKAGADVNWSNDSGHTALKFAVEQGEYRMVKLLLKNKAEVTKDAFFAAIDRGKSKVVDALIDSGANVNWTDDEGQTPLELAVGTENYETVKLLLEEEAKPTKKAFFNAIKRGKQNAVQDFIDAGADVNWEFSNNSTPLTMAAVNGYRDIVLMLIQDGADVSSRGTDGLTPLMFAAARGHQDTLQFLLEKGAEVSTEAPNGKTALSYANEYGHQEIATILEKNNQPVWEKHGVKLTIKEIVQADKMIHDKGDGDIRELEPTSFDDTFIGIHARLKNKSAESVVVSLDSFGFQIGRFLYKGAQGNFIDFGLDQGETLDGWIIISLPKRHAGNLPKLKAALIIGGREAPLELDTPPPKKKSVIRYGR